jgi:hypothetical protein
MPGASEDSPTYRGDIMRRMAVIQSRIDSLERVESPGSERARKQRELMGQLAVLLKEVMDYILTPSRQSFAP